MIQILCWLPGLFFYERVYRSRSRHEVGETAKTLRHLSLIRPPLYKNPRVPDAVLLRFATRKGQTAKPFLRFIWGPRELEKPAPSPIAYAKRRRHKRESRLCPRRPRPLPCQARESSHACRRA